MKSLFVTLFLVASAYADTLLFVATPQTVSGPGYVDFYAHGLDGTELSGQPISLDLLLGNDLARLYVNDPHAFGVELELFTNFGPTPEFFTFADGWLLDANGNGFAPQVAGRAGCDNALIAGLVSFTSADFGGANAVDISGAHFDLGLPNNDLVVDGAQLRFSLNNPSDGIAFGTAQQLPEASSWPLLMIATGCLIVFSRR